MKRNLFIASTASALFVSRPLLAKAGHLRQRVLTETNVGSGRWHNPSWFCESATVWLDTTSGVYHYNGDRLYGCTEDGAYTCEKEAIAAGYRAYLESADDG
jgi:hypothetical protein